MKSYAGIGSRVTPKNVCGLMTAIAGNLATAQYTLRSGGAKGADESFELGAGSKKEIYIPWNNFRGRKHNNSTIFDATLLYNYNEAVDISKQYHPKWNNLNDAGKKFHTRNVYQILGRELNDPVDMVVCWTQDGKVTGGTGQALRIAKNYNIEIVNLFQYDDNLDEFME